jgi:hypothetical protein
MTGREIRDIKGGSEMAHTVYMCWPSRTDADARSTERKKPRKPKPVMDSMD